jgi:hypothetical protein
MADGDLNLTSISVLARHLTDENHYMLFDAVCRKSKREVERLVACLDPQPDVPASVRKVPSRTVPAKSSTTAAPPLTSLLAIEPGEPTAVTTPRPAARAVVSALAPERYLLKMTVSRETHAKLERARDLLRHVIPTGDPAAILDRALTMLIEQLERTKHARTTRPRENERRLSVGRHIPASVKRAVWARDAGRCAFVGTNGRCTETGCLEFHHVLPFAVGGPATVENLELRCRSHNAYEADRFFGELCPDRVG